MHGDGLQELAKADIEIDAHSQTHRNLKHISDVELNDEIAGSVSDLESLGLNRPRLFAYPYGEYDLSIQKATQRAKLQAAFAVTPRRLRIGQNPYTIPRIEILRGDLGWRLKFKVALAGRSVIRGKHHEPN